MQTQACALQTSVCSPSFCRASTLPWTHTHTSRGRVCACPVLSGLFLRRREKWSKLCDQTPGMTFWLSQVSLITHTQIHTPSFTQSNSCTHKPPSTHTHTKFLSLIKHTHNNVLTLTKMNLQHICLVFQPHWCLYTPSLLKALTMSGGVDKFKLRLL